MHTMRSISICYSVDRCRTADQSSSADIFFATSEHDQDKHPP
jgi:hypothetical protein